MSDRMQPWLTTVVEGPLLPPAEAASYLGVSRASFYRFVEDGVLPRPILMGTRASGLPKSWLDSILAARAAASLEIAQ